MVATPDDVHFGIGKWCRPTYRQHHEAGPLSGGNGLGIHMQEQAELARDKYPQRTGAFAGQGMESVSVQPCQARRKAVKESSELAFD